MKKYLIAISILVASIGTVLYCAVLSRAEQIRFSQYIAPLECIRERVDDGVTTRYFLSPDECNGVVGGEEAKPNSQTSNAAAPDTGIFKLSRVAQSDVWWIVLLIVLLLTARRLYRRVSQ